MKDYYDVLGVHSLASHDEIKSAYRRLVVIYHPDRNTDPGADQRIREINEAYDVLSDPDKRRKYDLRTSPGWQTFVEQEHSPAHRDPAYRRRRHAPPPQDKPGIPELMLRFLPYAKRISKLALFFCMTLVLDFGLPPKALLEKIIDVHEYQIQTNGSKPKRYSIIITTNYDNRYSFTTHQRDDFAVDKLILIGRSRLLGIPLYVQSMGRTKERFYGTLFANFLFLPVILTIGSLLGVFYKQKPEFMFSLGVVNGFILVLSLILYFLQR